MQTIFTTSNVVASGNLDFPSLDEARERELLLRARAPVSTNESRAALTELWMSHGKLVAAIARKFRRPGIDDEDLINAGHLGLHTAITRFDTERYDTRLSSFATVWIRWYITDYIRRNSGPVRLPESKAHRQLAQCGPRLLAEARKACDREGVNPTDHELHRRIGGRLGLSADEVARGFRVIQGAGQSLHTQSDEGEYESNLPDDAAPSADQLHERMDHDRLRLRIRTLVNEMLGERERIVFLARSMARTNEVPSLETFAEQFGISTTRVHQIEISARRKIAVALAASGYADVTGDDVVAQLTQIRARRVVSTTLPPGTVSGDDKPGVRAGSSGGLNARALPCERAAQAPSPLGAITVIFFIPRRAAGAVVVLADLLANRRSRTGARHGD